MIRSRSCHLWQTAFGSRALISTTSLPGLALTLALALCAGPAFGRAANGTMPCDLSSSTASPGSTVTLDLSLEDALDVPGYQATILISRTFGTGEVTVPCSGRVEIDDDRSANIASGFYTCKVHFDRSCCGEVVQILQGDESWQSG